MKYEPDTHYLASKMVENLGWKESLAEMVDNSFDAGADRVEIALKAKTLTVSDNGKGCTDLHAMVTLGAHRRQSTTSLGMHGRGLKDAWLYLGDKIEIESHHGGVARTLSLDVKELIANNWEGPDPVSTTRQGKGTTIRFPSIRRTAWKENTVGELCKTFMPALNDGRQIVLKSRKSIRLKAFVLPVTTDPIVDSFDIDGKTVSISIGIIPDGHRNTTRGLLYTYGHRVITEAALGTKEYSCSRLAGTVSLGKGWKLTPHKNGIGECTDTLEDAIFDRIQWIAKKAHQQSMIAESDAFKIEIETQLNKGLATLRERRNHTGEREGAVLPATTGRKRKRAAKTTDNPGSVEGKQKSRRGIIIDLANYGEDEPFGVADSMANRVTLNADHPFVANNWNKNTDAIAAAAFGVFCHNRCSTDGPQKMIFEKFDFPTAWSAMLMSLRGEQDERDAKRA